MDTETCGRILGLILDEYATSGAVLAPSLDALYTVGGRREYAGKALRHMARMRRDVVSAIPEERFMKSLGDIIKIGKVKLPEGGRSQMRYVRKEGATVLELTAAWNVERKRAAEADARHSVLVDIFTAVLPTMPPGVTLEEHYAAAVQRYHQSQPHAQRVHARSAKR